MKQTTFKEWEDANIFLYKEHWDHPLILKANKSAFRANDEYIEQLETKISQADSGLEFAYEYIRTRRRSKNRGDDDACLVAFSNLKALREDKEKK